LSWSEHALSRVEIATRCSCVPIEILPTGGEGTAMTIRPLFAIARVSPFAFLPACRGSTEAPVEEAAVEETAEVEGRVSGVTAFWEMYEFGFDWAADLHPLSLTSGLIADDAEAVDAAGGVATVWSAIFVSPGQREAREFTY